MTNTFRNTPEAISSIAFSFYKIASNVVDGAFGEVQKVLPQLSKSGAKTMALGIAFFALTATTGLPPLCGAVFGNFAFSWAERALVVFNDQTFTIKLAVVATSVATLALARFKNFLPNDCLKTFALAALGFYTGFALMDFVKQR